MLLLLLALEVGAFAMVLELVDSLAVFVGYLLLHAGASFFTALLLSELIPPEYRRPRRWVVGFFSAYSFFMPIVGILSVVLGLVVGTRFPVFFHINRYFIKKAPHYTTHRNREGSGFRSGRVRSQLSNPETPMDHRLNALMALQDAPARITADLLRRLLSDPMEDLRLLSYGILEGKEKQIAHRIQDARDSMAHLTTDEERYAAYKRIAELYFELIYQNLVQGDMRLFCVDQVRENVTKAHEFLPDSGLWFMLARLELMQRNTEAAEQALLKAGAENFTRQRLLPYLAELRFLQRRFGEVRALFEESGRGVGLPALLPFSYYWTAVSNSDTGKDKPQQMMVLEELPSPVQEHG